LNSSARAVWPAITWSLAGIVLVAVPSAVVLWSWLAGDLPDQEAWFAESNHGPWRWESRGLAVAAAIYGLLAIAIGSLLHGLVFAARHRSGRTVVPFVASSAFSVGLLILALSQLFWLID
jgi:hypothetical protein